MSGSKFSAPGSSAPSEPVSPLSFTVHPMPTPQLGDVGRRTTSGRLKMLLVLLVCAAPVFASYFTYFVIRPDGRTNYSELIVPAQPIPVALELTDLQGRSVAPQSLTGQWLIVVVAGGACNAVCEKHLWLQRQLRETLGREKDRLDNIWLVPDSATPSPQLVQAISTHTEIAILHVPQGALGGWLKAAPGNVLEDHMYVVDPQGNWMMRVPPQAEPAKVKRDIEKLLRASAGWDKAGR